MIPAKVLRAIRNDLPMPVTIRNLGRDGPYSKMIEGFFRFVCPFCHEIRATVNPRNNLAHCFCCQKNINNIDLIMSLGYDFLGAVELLKKWLKKYQPSQRSYGSTGKQSGPTASDFKREKLREDHPHRTMKLGDFLSKISQSVGKR